MSYTKLASKLKMPPQRRHTAKVLLCIPDADLEEMTAIAIWMRQPRSETMRVAIAAAVESFKEKHDIGPTETIAEALIRRTASLNPVTSPPESISLPAYTRGQSEPVLSTADPQ